MPITLAIDARFVTPHLSGIGRYTLNLLHGISALEPKVPILVMRSPATPLPKSVMELKCFEFVDFDASPWHMPSQWKIATLLEARGVSLLHSPDVFGPIRGKFKKVVTLHDMIPITCRHIGKRSRKSQVWWAWRWWLKLQCGRADAVLTDSQASKRDIESIVGVSPKKVHVVYPGVHEADPGDSAGQGNPPESGIDPAPFIDSYPMVLYVGRMDPYKNVAGLVRAFALLHQRMDGKVRLVIVGRADARFNEAPAEAARLGITQAVRFTGQISDDQLNDLYRQANVLAFPSLYEGFGLPPLEAMRHGVPVVASNRSCMPEVLGDAAILIDATQAQAFGDAMFTVINEPRIAGDLRKRGHERVGMFTAIEQARKTMMTYESLLAGKDAR